MKTEIKTPAELNAYIASVVDAAIAEAGDELNTHMVPRCAGPTPLTTREVLASPNSREIETAARVLRERIQAGRIVGDDVRKAGALLQAMLAHWNLRGVAEMKYGRAAIACANAAVFSAHCSTKTRTGQDTPATFAQGLPVVFDTAARRPSAK